MIRASWPYALRAMRHADFRLYFFGQILSFTGTWMQSAGLYWLVYRLTGNEVLLGTTAFVIGISGFVVAPLAGVLVDRKSRRKVVLATQLLSFLQALALTLLTWLDLISVEVILLLSLFLGLIHGVDMTARQALVGEMAPPEDLPSAIAIASSSFNVARLVGPSLGGLALAWFGESVCFGLNTASYLFILGALLAMKGRPEAEPAATSRNALADLREGISYARKNEHTRAILPLIALASTAGAYFSLLPSLATRQFHLGARGYGLLGSAPGLGSLLGAILLARIPERIEIKRSLWGCFALAGGLLLLSTTRSIALALLFLVGVGFGMTTMYSSANAVLQTRTPQEIRGRVMSLYIMCFSGAQPVGALLLGKLAAVWGPAVALGAGGLGALLVASVVLALRRKTS